MPNAQRFSITPVYESGQQGPALNLLSLFEAYHNAASDLEDADLEQAAADSRAMVEREVSNHWAR
jgi:hypothetical protein